MTSFWLGTFEINAPQPAPGPSPRLPEDMRSLALEVLQDGNDFAVLVSRVDDVHDPRKLTCLIGFTNAAKACNVWHDRGFPLIDAKIDPLTQPGTLSLVAPCFHDGSSMQYQAKLLELSGISLGVAAPQANAAALVTHYEQELRSPDVAQPGIRISRRAVTWTPERSGVHQWPQGYPPHLNLNLGSTPARCPSLEPLTTGVLRLAGVWTGSIRLPSTQGRRLGDKLDPIEAADTFGVPAFRFENVEVLGFRVDLAAFGRDFTEDLAALVKPLNFHLHGHGQSGRRRLPIPDFRYQSAAPTLLIELLRYGQMKSTAPRPPLTTDDTQSQHELVVRLLVGRVDDDTAQAYAPAVYVPALFVDNPWSKVLGRDMLGYDKRIADFCVLRKGRPARLLPDGRLAEPPPGGTGGIPVPLGDISRINLVESTGLAQGPPVLELDYSGANHTYPDVLELLNLSSAFGLSLLAAVRWRLSDFDVAEFRRSFAQLAISESVRAFRCVQAAPIVDRALDKTWVTGKFVVDADIRAGIPVGVANLTLHAVQPNPQRPSASTAPEAWNLLCKMLGDGHTAQLRLPTGSWYRMVCSMDLTIDDGLGWTDPTA